MTNLCVPYYNSEILSEYLLYKITFEQDDSEIWRLRDAVDNNTLIEKKFNDLQSYFKRWCNTQDCPGEFSMETLKKPVSNLNKLNDQTPSVFLGLFLKAAERIQRRKFKDDWQIICVTGNLTYDKEEGVLSLGSVGDIEKKYKEQFLKFAKNNEQEEYLFLYVSNETEITDLIECGECKNITIRHFTTDNTIDDIINCVFKPVSLIFASDDLEDDQKNLVERMEEMAAPDYGYTCGEGFEHLQNKMTRKDWRGFYICGASGSGKSATAMTLAKYLTKTRKIYAPIWIKIENNEIQKKIKQEMENNLDDVRKKPVEAETYITAVIESLMGKTEYIKRQKYLVVIDNLKLTKDETIRVLNAVYNVFSGFKPKPYYIVTSTAGPRPGESDFYKTIKRFKLSIEEAPRLNRDQIGELITKIADDDISDKDKIKIAKKDNTFDELTKIFFQKFNGLPQRIVENIWKLEYMDVPELLREISTGPEPEVSETAANPAPIPSGPDKSDRVQTEYLKYLELECGFQASDLPVSRKTPLRVTAFEDFFVPFRFAIIPSHWDALKSNFDDKYIEAHKYWYGFTCPVPNENDDNSRPFRGIIFSDPGCGKTTFMRHLLSAYGLGKSAAAKDHLPKRTLFPVWIKCQDFTDIGELTILNIIRKIPERAFFDYNEHTADAFYQLVMQHFDSGDAVLLIDGLDEITDAKSRLKFINQIQVFSKNEIYKKVNILLTSRLVSLKQVGDNLVEGYRRWLIMPFNKNETEQFCINWYHILNSSRETALKAGKKLSDKIIANNSNLAQNPLLLKFMLIINNQSGCRLPIKRTELFLTVIRLLLDGWGQMVRGKTDSRTAIPYLSYIAYQMMFKNRTTRAIRESELIKYLGEASLHLKEYPLPGTFQQFIDDIEDRGSLIIKRVNGAENSPFTEAEYEFQHLTFKEFFAAYAVKNEYYQGKAGIGDHFKGNWENPALREVVLLASALADKNGAEELTDALLKRLEEVKACRNANRQSVIDYLKNLLLKIIDNDAELDLDYRNKIYKAYFSAPISPRIFKNDFISIYEARRSAPKDLRNEMTKMLLFLGKEKKNPIYSSMPELLKRQGEPNSYLYDYYEEKKKDGGLIEALKLFYAYFWFNSDSSDSRRNTRKPKSIDKNEYLKKELLNYCMNSGERQLVSLSYETLALLCGKQDPVFDEKLLSSIIRFFPGVRLEYGIDYFPITKKLLRFLNDTSLAGEQTDFLQKAINEELDTHSLLRYFWVGVFFRIWDIKTTIKKAMEFHRAAYLSKDDSNRLFIRMKEYLSVMREIGLETPETKELAEKYQNDAVGRHNNAEAAKSIEPFDNQADFQRKSEDD